MSTSSAKASQLIAALGEHLGTDLRLDNDVCALFDANEREAVVIEAPEHSDSLILHCKLDAPTHSPGLHKRLLEMNFRLDVLRGCWLALDDQGTVRLCTQCPLKMLDEIGFCHWVVGFIAQIEELQPVLAGMKPSPLAVTDSGQHSRLGSSKLPRR